MAKPEAFGRHTLPRKQGYRLDNLAEVRRAKRGEPAKPAVVICARCNQPTEGDRTCTTCSKIGVRELHPGEADPARAAAIAEIVASLKSKRRWV